MESPNVLNEVLSPAKADRGIVPREEAPTEVLLGCARELQGVFVRLEAPRLNSERRRALAGQSRVYQGGVTAIALRILQRSPRTADEAELPPDAVENLLLFETGAGAVRRAAWPTARYALSRARQSGERVDSILRKINEFAASPKGQRVALALALCSRVQQRGERSQQVRQAGLKGRRAAAQERVQQQVRRVAGGRLGQRLAGELHAGKAGIPPGKVPARGKKPEGDNT